MRDVRRKIWPGLAALTLLGLGWWLSRPAPSPPSEGAASGPPAPDYYLTDATVRRYTRDTRLAASLHSPRITHQQDSGVWRLQRPRWRYRGEYDWRGSADRGVLHIGRDVGSLIGHVRLYRQSGAPLTLTTSRLQIQPRRGFAETDRPVTLSGTSWRQRALGARVWLDSEQLRLLSRVEGSYEVSRQP